MSNMSRSLAVAIQQGSENSILQYDKVIEETEFRMISALAALDRYEDFQNLTPKLLSEFCREHKLLHIIVYDKSEKQLLSNSDSLPPFPADNRFKPLFLNQKQEMVLGFQAAKGEKGERFIVAIPRYQGGIFEAQIDAVELTHIQKNLGIASLLNSIIEDPSIQYIAIQDSIGILAASRNIRDLSSIKMDTFLSNILSNSNFEYRLTEFKGEKIYESAMPFTVNTVQYGLIRIGIDSSSITEINKAAIRNAIIRLTIILLLSFILITYSVLIQNHKLLQSEKEEISGEVYVLQEDLRRREKLSAMGELAAGVAHEIRNPLNAISLSAQRLLKRLKGDDYKNEQSMIHSIREEIHRLDEIIRQFLNFARPAPLIKNAVLLDEIIKKSLSLYTATFEKSKILLNFESEKNINIQADNNKLQQVFVNLLENSLHAMPEGGKLNIHIKRDKKTAIISFKDSGIGIPEENLAKIFNLYFTNKREGNGLGLAQVYQIITEHLGSIQVQSEINQGTEFIIRLPLK